MFNVGRTRQARVFFASRRSPRRDGPRSARSSRHREDSLYLIIVARRCRPHPVSSKAIASLRTPSRSTDREVDAGPDGLPPRSVIVFEARRRAALLLPNVPRQL